MYLLHSSIGLSCREEQLSLPQQQVTEYSCLPFEMLVIVGFQYHILYVDIIVSQCFHF